MKNTIISYIIVSYNVKDYVLSAIQSIYNHSSKYEFEIIMVDNISADGTVEAVSKQFPEVIIIENNHNAGFSEANNQGFAKSNGEYLFMLNPDAELTANSIDLMMDYLENEPSPAINKNSLIGPYLENTNGSFQKSYWKTPTPLTILGEIFFTNYIRRLFTQPKAHQSITLVESVSGAAMLFHKSILSSTGNLDPNLFWMDDTDFCYRIRRNGGKIIYFPNAHVIHHIGKSSSKNQNGTISNQILSKIKFFKKHHKICAYYLSIIFSSILVLEKISLFGISSLFNQKSKIKFNAYIYTLKRLIHFKKQASI